MKKITIAKNVFEGALVYWHGRQLRLLHRGSRRDKAAGVYTPGGPRVFEKTIYGIDGKRKYVRFDYVEPQGVITHGNVNVKMS
mgnify:CR=1 FL=1